MVDVNQLKTEGLLPEVEEAYGWDQGAAVKALFEAEGFENVIVVKDLGDRDRVVTNGPDPRTNPVPKM